jgi:hypothetical protein
MDLDGNDRGGNDLGWHVISGEVLLFYLKRARAGENPDLLFAELWANAEEVEDYRGGVE